MFLEKDLQSVMQPAMLCRILNMDQHMIGSAVGRHYTYGKCICMCMHVYIYRFYIIYRYMDARKDSHLWKKLARGLKNIPFLAGAECKAQDSPSRAKT